MFGSIINRLILAELVKVFLLALTALTGMFLVAGLIQEASQRGLSPGQIFMVLPLLIPNTLPYTIPATTLFATCVVYGRMSHDNEVLVLKSAGVNILHLLKPAVLLGVFATATTLLLYYDTIPRTQRLTRAKVLADAEEVLYGLLKRERGLRQPGAPYVMYVREVQGKRLLDVIFKRRAQTGPGYDVVARTREARLRLDLPNNQILVDMGRCVVYGEKDSVGAEVADRIYPIPLPDSMFGRDDKNRSSALTWMELNKRIDEVDTELHQAVEEADRFALERPGPSAPAADREGYEALSKVKRFQVEHLGRVRRNLIAESHMRPALAFGCLCFVLIGCPVGIWTSRSDYLSTFVICFLPTVFVYYPVLLAGTNLAKDGKVSPVAGVWAANALVAAAALFLIAKLMRR